MGRTTAGFVALVLTTGLLAASPPTSPPEGHRDDAEMARIEGKRLQGDWTMVALEVDGKKANANQTKTWLLVVEGNKYNPGSGSESIEYTFRIDPTRVPKAIDLTPVDGPHEGRVFRAVYALEGDLLTVCRPLDPSADRPAGLTARRGSGMTRVVWKRKKGS